MERIAKANLRGFNNPIRKPALIALVASSAPTVVARNKPRSSSADEQSDDR